MSAHEREAAEPDEELLDAPVLVPEHVVFRSFAQETVMLNLQTGKYHGLDPIGGRLLELVARAASLREAAARLAHEYDRPVSEVEADALEFCLALRERGLIEFGR